VQGLQRIAEVPIYHADAIVRRAPSLQKTRDAQPPLAWMNRALYARLGLREGDKVRVRQGDGAALVAPAVDDRLPAECIRLAAAREETADLGALFGELSVERVPAQQKMAV
jgi:NADH-quinone oxidoreductase subunit G